MKFCIMLVGQSPNDDAGKAESKIMLLRRHVKMVMCWECGCNVEIDLADEWSKNDNRAMHCRGSINLDLMPDYVWKRVYCAECTQKRIEQEKENKRLYGLYKAKMIFERAVKMLEKQKAPMYKLKEAINAVREFSEENTDKFDTAHEMVAAIVLINSRVKVKVQAKVENYHVDFMLPELKCLLEIDGEPHSRQALYDSNRDIKIRQILGADWEVVRIPNDRIEQNALLLMEMISKLKKLKQDTRKANGGIIPAGFSKRDREKAEEIERIAKS